MNNWHIQNLSAGYDKKEIIKGLDLVIKPGEIVSLIGPNGAGKSTILKTIAGLIPKLNGDVCIDDKSIFAMSRDEVSRLISVMLTEKNIVEYMTCYEVVSIGRYRYSGVFGRLDKNDNEIIKNVMEEVRALELADIEYSKTSDGQKQRVLLARALVSQPQILLLDEPTSFLDIGYKLEFLALLREMVSKKNMSVLMSMHEIELASKISDKVVCIDRSNHIDKIGAPKEVLTPDYIEYLFSIKPGVYGEFYHHE